LIKEIKGIVGQTAKEVDEGVRTVARAGEAIGRIRTGIKETDDLIAEIANTVADQSSTLAEVTAAVSEIDEITQQNAVMADETTRNVRQLEMEMTGISNTISEFTLTPRDQEDTSGMENERLAG